MKEKVVYMLARVRDKANILAVGATTALVCSMPAFAQSSGGSDDLVITTEMLSPVVDAVKANLKVIIPAGIILFGVILGVTMAPKLFKKFTS